MNEEQPVFCFINLGCAKNTVDAELLLAQLVKAGFLFTPEPEDADFCLVNTCGFIHDAREEVAEVLDELRELKRRRPGYQVIALGCLVERAGGDERLSCFLRHADHLVGFAHYPRLADLCRQWLARPDGGGSPARGFAGRQLPSDYMCFLNAPRMRIGHSASAYLKLSEGCSNHCAYCSIPLIKGDLVSRDMDDVARDAQSLIGAGALELNLISQDTAGYGKDRDDCPQLLSLLRTLLDVTGDCWLRLLYIHPRHLDEALLDLMQAEPRICPYLDVPLQHISDRMLKLMGRHIGQKETMQKLEWIRTRLPEAALRTTFITGHPGETDADHQEVMRLVASGIFDHMGVFIYSPEPGTRSASLPDDVPARLKQERLEELMSTQQDVSQKRLQKRVGRQDIMLVEETGYDGDRYLLVGRSQREAPEVDGEVVVSIPPGRDVSPGRFIHIQYTAASDYDLEAQWLEAL
ncbi:MAG: 30S ribosomal protein S12 methylthiotransferase RimO [Spartobacteria bacterium]|nr:30S ribosomal protein S12 methylthiotransferase RimO [Spartobacteria bacterium]